MFSRHRTTGTGKRCPLTGIGILFCSVVGLCLWSCALFSSPAFAYGEAAEQAAVKTAIETFLKSYGDEAMLYHSSDQTVCSVAAPQAAEAWGDDLVFQIGEKETSLADLRENIAFVEKKAAFYSAMRQMQGIYRENLQLSYRYPVFQLEDSFCHVSVTETASFYYVDSDRPSVYETVYSVDLVKLGGQWLVADITDGSRFDGLYKEDPAFDTAAALAAFEANLHTEACRVSNPSPPAAEDTEDGYLPYCGANAAAYAYTYSRQEARALREEFYNPLFRSYAGHGGDCMNFVSQCMWAGFGGSQTQRSVDSASLPMDTDGDSQWYSYGADSTAEPALSWVSCQSFRKYLTGALDGAGTEGSNASDDRGMCAAILDVGPGSPITGVPAESLIGAAAHVEGAGGPYAHAILLTDAVGTSRSEIWFCSHTKDMTHIKLGDYYFGPMKVYIPRYMRLSPPPFITPDALQPVEVSSAALVGFHTAEVSPHLRLTITPPGGTAEELVSVENSGVCAAEYTFPAAGLYRVDCRGVMPETEGEEVEQTASFYIRCYTPPERTPSAPPAPAPEPEPAPDLEPPDWLFS